MRKATIALLILCLLAVAGTAQARRGGGSVHFSFGLPLYWGPVYPPSYYYYPYYPRYYYPPPPVYYDDPLPPHQAVPVPEVRFEQAPEFIYSRDLGLFVSMGIPYDIVYDNVSYYLFYGGYWYKGRSYNGPWEIVTVSNLPARLLQNRIEQIRYQRDLEVRRYESMGEKYEGQFHRP